ncbi:MULTISPECIES: hypothetical protein [unclassified Duganella]|uniref:hypothetical protein n=1 Tax=unclassified Duganella TaxID=2636909 RepID=UPI0012E380DA|nr:MULTISPECIES: hypothetical protein [unclassified Duganella]
MSTIHITDEENSAAEQQQESTAAPRKSRARRQASDRAPWNPERAKRAEDEAYFRLLERQEVSDAIHELKRTQEIRDSVSRKLCGGSHAATVELLSRCECELAGAKAAVLELVQKNPRLARHPSVAALTATLNS